MIGSALSFFAVGLLLILIVSAIITAAISDAIGDLEGGKQATKVEEQSVLRIDFDDPIVERGNDKDFKINFNTFEPETNLGLNHILADIKKAKDDDRIEGIYMELSGVAAAPSTLQDIREQLEDFKESGKWIMAYGENYTQSAYYIASTADEVYLYPEGMMEFYGLYTELAFFKGMLEKLDVDMQVVRGPNNKYKSAVESFMLDEMSDENREQVQAYLDDIWDHMVDEMATARGISVEEMNTIADNLAVGLPEDAVMLGLIDGVKYEDEIMDMLKGKLGIEEDEADEEGEEDEERKTFFTKDDDGIAFVDLNDYHFAKVKKSKDDDEKDGDEENEKEDSKPSWKKDRVAVIYAVGAIESGEGDDMTIGSERIAGALREAREDERVKAVVLRVNSPGGSALASDVIWRETKLIQDAGKPFVVSMGDVAASGGYYISAAADHIYANENTITGSIGVFGLIPNLEGMFEEKLGVTFDRVSTNEHAGIMSATRPLEEAEKDWINKMIVDVYDEFLGRVADGRGMTKEEVDSIAQGRVWSGTAAKEIGLIDEFGNLEDAIDKAAELAELGDYKVKDLPEFKDPFEELMKEFSGQAKVEALIQETGVDSRYIEYMYQVKQMATHSEGKHCVQARMPYFMVTK